MKDVAEKAVEDALVTGADYADVRVKDIRARSIHVHNGNLEDISEERSRGYGIRSLVSGAWGFSSGCDFASKAIAKTAEQSVNTGRASARLREEPVELLPVDTVRDTWQTPIQVDPFSVDLQENIALLRSLDETLRDHDRIVAADSRLTFVREDVVVATTDGTLVDQRLYYSGGGYSVTAADESDFQVRSFPNSHGGYYRAGGYEVIPSMRLTENAERVREEAVSLLDAEPCPTGEMDVVLGGDQVALQIHESCGHPSELDRVLGTEESYAGSSFLTEEKAGEFRYGSECVDLIADGTVPGGLATRGYDDEGVKTRRYPVVKDGIFVGYQGDREFLSRVKDGAPGNVRADGWENVPLIRINNLSLSPGKGSKEDLISRVEDGIYMETNRSWSIDQKRYNFQFSCEIGWKIENGERTHMIKNPSYTGITPDFWSSCEAVAGKEEWDLWGLTNCGKGEPGQRARMSHGASPALFRDVRVIPDRS